MQSRSAHAVVRALAVVSTLVRVAFAQALPSNPTGPDGVPDDTPPVELSPLVISADAGAGWVATETLAGTRLRTDLRVVPNQIETLTKDFLDDFGLTDVEQSLMYTANVENRSDFVQTLTGLDLPRPAAGGRIRGISAGTLSRNFFQVRNPSDNFNLERITVASGPNAILFGLGSPAGILDATPARARMRDKLSLTLQFDSEDTRRAQFDANLVIVPGRLAMRIMGLSQREFTDKKPNLDREDRIYGAVSFSPFKNTTVTLQGERANRNWNYAARVNPADFVSLWYRADEIPGSGYTVARPPFDNQSFLGIANNRIFAQAAHAPVLVTNGSVRLQNWRNSVTVKNPSSLPWVDQTFDASVNTTILDPTVFPFDANIVGTTSSTLSGATTTTAIIEQEITGSLFLELAYNHEDFHEQRFAAGSDLTNNLYVDPNQFVPGTTTPNPNFGKLYVQGLASTEPGFEQRDGWRAMLTYEWDPEERLHSRSRWGKWLGRHRFSALYTGSMTDSKAQIGFMRRILDDPSIPGLTLRPKTMQGWAIHGTRIPQFRHYFDDPYDAATAAGPLTGDWVLADANGDAFTLYMTDTPLHADDGKRLGANQAATGSRVKSHAQIFVWQGFLLPDRDNDERLVITFGYRKDSARSATFDAASTAQDFSGLYPVVWDARFTDYGPRQTGINRNLGVVVRPLKRLGVFYNDSTTFNLNIGRYDPFGDEIPGASGKGRDFGLRLDFLQDRVSVRINRYENALGPQRASNQINVFRDIFFNLEDRVRTLDPAVPTINVVDGNRRGFRVAGRTNYFITSDLESTGYEVEINAMPVPEWNIRLNGALSKAVETSVGGLWFEWAAQRLPVWQAVVAKNGEVDAAGHPVTWKTAEWSATSPDGRTLEQYYNSALVGQAFNFMRAVDGRATEGARGSRINLISTYSFSHGSFKGLSIGGALRWRDAPIIGYGVASTPGGGTILDLDQPFKGRDELYCDAVVGFRGRAKALGGLSYRVQLNIRNLFNDDEPIPVVRSTTGAVTKIATVEPRVLVATFGVEF